MTVVLRLFNDSGPQALYLHWSLGSLVTVFLRLLTEAFDVFCRCHKVLYRVLPLSRGSLSCSAVVIRFFNDGGFCRVLPLS